MKTRRGVCFAVTVVCMLGFLGMSGCATYSRAPAKYAQRSSGFQVTLPTGWLRYTPAQSGMTITRDGMRLEKITILVTRFGKELPGTKRVYNADMLPHEAADLFIELAKAQNDTHNFEVGKIDLTPVANQDGFRIDAAYVDEQGLHKKIRTYGVVTDTHVCNLVFDAANPTYFKRYEDVFKSIVDSARFVR